MKSMNITKGLLVAASVGTLVAATWGCDQPLPKCSSARGNFAAQYLLISGDPGCEAIKGEVIAMQTYYAVGEGQPNQDKASVAIGTVTMGTAYDNAQLASVVDPDPTHKFYALGPFIDSEPVNNVCHAPKLAAATKTFPEIAEDAALGTSAQPATTITYEWSNFITFVTSVSSGTSVAADLTFKQDAMTCKFRVNALSPAVDCSKPDPNDEKKSIPVDTACAPEANLDAGRPTGSGINPDYKTHCDPDLLLCVVNDANRLLKGLK